MAEDQGGAGGGPTRVEGGRFAKGASGNPKGRPRAARHDSASPPAGEVVEGPRRRRGKLRVDGWGSSLGGVGVSGIDKRLSGTFYADVVAPEDAAEMWRGDDLAARAIESVPNEMLRQGFDLAIGGGVADAKLLSEKVSGAWEDLGLSAALQEALCYERAYGGAAIFLGVNDGRPIDEPLDFERAASLDFLTVLEARELTPFRYYADATKPRFGQVASYQVNPTSPGTPVDGTGGPQRMVEVHASRLLVFPGVRVSRRRYHAARGWGDSVLTRMVGVLRDFNMAHAAAGILIADFAQPIFSIKGLAEMIADDEDEVLAARMEAVELSRSVARLVMVDSEEKYERSTTPVSGLPELLEALRIRLAAAADMPVTLLMGQSPNGMNATGESDVRFYYDRIRSAQEKKLRPAIETVTKLLFRSLKIVEPESWSIRFHPLWQPTEGERAAARLTQAQVDAIYIERGVVSEEEIAVSRFGGDEFSFETVVDFDAREELAPKPDDLEAREGDEPADPATDPAEPTTVEAPASGAPAPEAGVNVAATALNGAQVEALIGIVQQVVGGTLSRPSAIAIIEIAFRISTAEAERILGPTDFVPAPPATEGATVFEAPPAPPAGKPEPLFDAAPPPRERREDESDDPEPTDR